MAKSNIPEGKKRYQFTLTVENMEKFSYFITQVEGKSPNQVSSAIDSMISSVVDSIQPLIDRYASTGRRPSSADAMIIFGKAMQEIGTDEIKLPFDK